MLSRIFRDDVENAQANRKRQIDTLKVFNDKYVSLILLDINYDMSKSSNYLDLDTIFKK